MLKVFVKVEKNYERDREEIGGYWSIQVEGPTNEAKHTHCDHQTFPRAVFLKFGQLYLPRPAEGISYSNILLDINLYLHPTTNETKHTLNTTI